MAVTPPVQPSPVHAKGAPPDALLDALLQVFSARGFDGASLAELARASGRSKASLYHHFPNGKTQMIELLVQRCRQTLDATAFAPLRQITASAPAKPGSKAHNRERAAAHEALAAFVDGFAGYLQAQDGNCLLATLALTQPELLGQPQRELVADWHTCLARCCELAGHKPKAARRLAQASLARLYGSLTLAAMGSHIPVRQACKWLKRDLLPEN